MAEEIRRKINILEAHSSLGYAGGQRNLVSFAKYLDKNLFQVFAMGYREGGVQEKRLAELGIEAINGAGDIGKILSFIAEKKIDVIHLHRSGGYVPLETAIIAGAKQINPRIAIVEKNVFGQHDPISGNDIDCHLFQSMMHLNEKYLPASGEQFDFARHKVMYNIVDAAAFESYRLSEQAILSAKAELGIESDEFVIAKIGRPHVAKWSDLVLDMMPYLVKLQPRLKFIIVGMPLSRRQRIARSRFSRYFIVLDEITEERRLHEIYQLIDVLAHSSKIGECNGNTINEAMFWGKPVVVNSTPDRDNGQLEQVINGVNGYIANHPETFARALHDLAIHPDRRRHFGQAGRNQVLTVNEPRKLTAALAETILSSLNMSPTDSEPSASLPSATDIINYQTLYRERLRDEYGKLSFNEKIRALLRRPGQKCRQLSDFLATLSGQSDWQRHLWRLLAVKVQTLFSQPYVLPALLALLFLFVPLLTYWHLPLYGDYSEYYNNPVRLLHGDLPYNDFWLLHSPGEVYFPAVLYQLFGVNVNFAELGTIISNVIIGLAIFLLCRRLFKSDFLAAFVAIMSYFAGEIFYYGNFIYIHWHLLFSFLGAYFIIQADHAGTKANQKLFLAGIFLGLALFFKTFIVLALAAAGLGVWLMWHHSSWRAVARNLLAGAAGFFIGSLPFIFFVCMAGQPLNIFWQLFIDPIYHNAAFKSIPYFDSVIYYWMQLKQAHGLSGQAAYDAMQLLFTAALYLLPAIALTVAVAYWRTEQLSRHDKFILVLFLLWGALEFGQAYKLAGLEHVAVMFLPFLAALAYCCRRRSRLINCLLIGCMILAVSFAAMQMFNRCRQYDLGTINHQTVAVARGDEILPQVFLELDHLAEQKKSVVIFADLLPPLYAYYNLSNPLYYDSNIDLRVRPAASKQLGVCNELESSQPAVIVYQAGEISGSLPIIVDCFSKKYHIYKTIGDYNIIVKNNP